MTEQEVYEFVNNLLEKFEGDRVTTNYNTVISLIADLDDNIVSTSVKGALDTNDLLELARSMQVTLNNLIDAAYADENEKEKSIQNVVTSIMGLTGTFAQVVGGASNPATGLYLFNMLDIATDCLKNGLDFANQFVAQITEAELQTHANYGKENEETAEEREERRKRQERLNFARELKKDVLNINNVCSLTKNI